MSCAAQINRITIRGQIGTSQDIKNFRTFDEPGTRRLIIGLAINLLAW